jgi:hypothetical protein
MSVSKGDKVLFQYTLKDYDSRKNPEDWETLSQKNPSVWVRHSDSKDVSIEFEHFPLKDYHDLDSKVKIDDEEYVLDGFDITCIDGQYGECHISVKVKK